MATVRELQAKFTAQIDGLKSGLRNAKTEFQSFRQENEKTIKATQQKWEDAGATMSKIGKGARNYLTIPLVAAATLSGKAAMDFESAFAGVRKTVDASEAEFKVLEQGIRNMAKELPASTTEIAAVAEAAGQLGIKKESILEFTKTMIDLGESTNLTADEAATAFARFANITQMPQEQFDNLGSSVVALGNNMATTESEIVNMAMRLAGTGAQIGLSESEIMALAASMSSVGIEAEAGGTAMSMVMKKMQNAVSGGVSESNKDLAAFASAAGMSAQEFADAFNNDPITAIDALVKGLAKSGDSGENLNGILEDLGIKGIRESDTMLRLAGASELLGDAVDISNTAFEENVALTEEANQRYETSESKLEIFKNKVKDLGITFGEILLPVAMQAVDWAGDWIDRLNNMDEKTQKMAIAVGAGAAAFGLIMPLVGGLVTTIAPLAGLISAAGGASVVFGGALAALTGPVGIAVGAIAALTLGGMALVAYFSQSALPEIDRFGEGVSDSTKEALGAFFDMSDGIEESLMQLKTNGGELTQEIAESLKGNFAGMNADILEGMKTSHKDQLEQLDTFFLNSSVLTDEREREIMTNTRSKQAVEKAEQEGHFARINEIVDTALKEKRDLTVAEEAAIDAIKDEMMKKGIKHLTENQREQEVILAQMTATADLLTREQAAKVVANSAKQKEQVIQDANDTYDDKVATAIMLRDELGEITAEEADEMIRQAKRERDETVQHAEDRHAEVVKEAEKQSGSLEDIMDTHTGKMYDKWDALMARLKRNIATHNEAQADDFRRAYRLFETIFDNWGNNMNTALSLIKSGLLRKYEGLSAEAQAKIRAMVNGIITGMNFVLRGFKLKELPLWRQSTAAGSGRSAGSSSGAPVRAYEHGTDHHPGGPAIVGDGEGVNAGPELIRLPDGRFGLSPAKPTLVDLPRGAMVLAAQKTKDFFSGVPMYANGVGDVLTHAWKAGTDMFQKGKKLAFDVFDYATDPAKLLNKALEWTGFNPSGGPGFIGDAVRGGIKMLKGKAVDYLKGLLGDWGMSGSGGTGDGFPGFRKSSSYSVRIHPITGIRTPHMGDDWAAPAGTPIPSQAAGRVIAAGYHNIRGNYVKIQSGPLQRIYQHNTRNLVGVGDLVRKGQYIGTVGSTGRSTGPHLHYEVLRNGKHINPSGYANGGIIDKKTLAWLAEGGWSESVISHDPAKQETQKRIWEKTGDALGFNDDVLGEKILDALERIARGVETVDDIQMVMSDRKVGKLVAKHAKKEEDLERKRKLAFEPKGAY